MDMLKKLRLSQLRRLAVNCGTARGGTKASLIQGILNGVPKAVRQGNRIVSIDIGLKNIAICEFLIQENVPLVKRWTLLPLDGWDQPGAFQQPQFASLALDFMNKTVSGDSNHSSGHNIIDALLIEEQRMRSGGSRSVAETIARINILENMLHAIAITKKDKFKYIESVSPSKVTAYWMDPLESKNDESAGNLDEKSKEASPKKESQKHAKAGLRYRQTKKSKIKVAMELLEKTNNNENSKLFNLESGILGHVEELIRRHKKRDDLSDCLLQGLAWIQWQTNLQLVQQALHQENLNMIVRMVETNR